MIHNEKIDKKFIRDVFDYYENSNVKNKKDLRRPWRPTNITYGLEHSDYFHVNLEYERGHYDAGISMTDIERLQRKYRFCSMGIIKNGISIVLQKPRWNDCDDCGKVIWISQPFEHVIEWFDEGFIHTKNHVVKMVCSKCNEKRRSKNNGRRSKF